MMRSASTALLLALLIIQSLRRKEVVS
jgi:hypothetical protein